MTDFIKEYQINNLGLCDKIIEYFDQSELDGLTYNGVCGEGFWSPSSKKSRDMYFNDSNLYQQYLKEIDPFLEDYCKFIDIESHNSIVQLSNVQIQHYKPNEGFYAWHIDTVSGNHRAITFITYLNNVLDGGTEFKLQNKLVEAKKGKTVVFPASITHIHRGQISKTSNKYIATGWLDWK